MLLKTRKILPKDSTVCPLIVFCVALQDSVFTRRLWEEKQKVCDTTSQNASM